MLTSPVNLNIISVHTMMLLLLMVNHLGDIHLLRNALGEGGMSPVFLQCVTKRYTYLFVYYRHSKNIKDIPFNCQIEWMGVLVIYKTRSI